MEIDRAGREAVVRRLARQGLLERFRAVVADEGAVESWCLALTVQTAAVRVRERWWVELSRDGWSDAEIAELHGTTRRFVQRVVMRGLRRAA